MLIQQNLSLQQQPTPQPSKKVADLKKLLEFWQHFRSADELTNAHLKNLVLQFEEQKFGI